MSIDAINPLTNEFAHLPMDVEYLPEVALPPAPTNTRQYIDINQVKQAVEAANNGDDIDFETVITEMAKLLIQGQKTREEHFFHVSQRCQTVWMSNVHRHAAEYSNANWHVWFFPVVKSGLDVAKIGGVVFNQDSIVKLSGFVQSFFESGKEYFGTIDTGKRTEMQAYVELSKLLFERNERENQSYSQQVQEAFRKYDEAKRRREEIEAAMARA